MPAYDYRCRTCGSHFTLRFESIQAMQVSEPMCPQCQSMDLAELIRKVNITTSEDVRISKLVDPSNFSGLDDDPKALGRYMSTIAKESGEDFGKDYTEVAQRLESGESVESIDDSMTVD